MKKKKVAVSLILFVLVSLLILDNKQFIGQIVSNDEVIEWHFHDERELG